MMLRPLVEGPELALSAATAVKTLRCLDPQPCLLRARPDLSGCCIVVNASGRHLLPFLGFLVSRVLRGSWALQLSAKELEAVELGSGVAC